MDIDAQVRFGVSTIPGVEDGQFRLLLEEAFRRGSTVVVGGSRVRESFGRGTCRRDSDLDVGFGSLTGAQAARVERKVSAVGPLTLEKTRIVPGNQPPGIPRIQTPEEFFQRSGFRSPNDPQAGQPFEPSGRTRLRPTARSSSRCRPAHRDYWLPGVISEDRGHALCR
jgi:hypothetical protein